MNVTVTKMSKTVPSWAVKDDYEVLSSISESRLVKIAKTNVTEQDLENELELIEKCASSNENYIYNSSWEKSIISQLKEYATITGLKNENFIGVDASCPCLKASSSNMIKTASTTTTDIKQEKQEKQENKLGTVFENVFNIEKKAESDYMKKADWQKNEKQQELTDNPSMMSNTVKALRGGENYNKNSNRCVAPGQNSILDPEAIEKLAKSDNLDSRTAIRNEKTKREADRNNAKKEWESELKNTMEKEYGLNKKGKIFATEILELKSGSVNEKKNAEMPEKTTGETIKEHNETIKQQRINDNDKWQTVASQKQFSISDTFANSLKNALNKKDK